MARTAKGLYLLRHAKSSWDDVQLDDHERPLSRRGEDSVRKLRRHLRHAGVAPALVLCSSARRTVMTWEGVRSAFPDGTVVVFEDALYAASSDRLLRRLHGVDDDVPSVLLIGHNPGLEDLADRLVGAGAAELRRRLETKFPTGALVELAFDDAWADLQPGAATLVSFVVPRDLA